MGRHLKPSALLRMVVLRALMGELCRQHEPRNALAAFFRYTDNVSISQLAVNSVRIFLLRGPPSAAGTNASPCWTFLSVLFVLLVLWQRGSSAARHWPSCKLQDGTYTLHTTRICSSWRHGSMVDRPRDCWAPADVSSSSPQLYNV
eukprot:scaffold26333_cov90-Isochrysis_galbana.AAC.1